MSTQNFVTVVARFEDSVFGTVDYEARLIFRERFVITDTDDVTIRIPKEYTFTAIDMAAGVRILATDDVNANPSQWYYEVYESWSGLTKNVVIPADSPGGVLNYANLATVSDPPVTIPTIVRRVNGQSPDEHGDIIISIPDPGTGDGDPVLGGVLAGTASTAAFAQDMATQAELNTVAANANSRMHFVGFWTAGTTYQRDDVVLYKRTTDPAGSYTTLRCNATHLASAPISFTPWDEQGNSGTRTNLLYLAQPWTANRVYQQYGFALRPSDGVLIQAKAAGSSGTFVSSSWTVLGGSGGTATGGGSPEVTTVQASGYKLTLADANTVLELPDGSPATELPAHSEVPLPVGTVVRRRVMGTSPVAFKAGPGVTLNTPYPLTPTSLASFQSDGTKWLTLKASKRGLYDWVVGEDVAPSIALPASVNLTVNLSTTDHVVDPVTQFSYAVTGYTSSSGDIRASASLQASVAALGAGCYRFGVAWDSNTNKPVAGAASAINDTAGAQAWVAGIVAANPSAKLVILLEGAGNTLSSECGVTPTEAANIVQWALDHSWPVEGYVVGNEPDHGSHKLDWRGRLTENGVTFGQLFCEIGAAVKAVDSSAKLWGPATTAQGNKMRANQAAIDALSPVANPGDPRRFFNDFIVQTGYGTSVATLLDVLCWHHYLSGTAGDDVSTSGMMAKTSAHYSEILAAKTFIANYVPAKTASMKYSINEWNIFYIPGNGRNVLRDDVSATPNLDERTITAEGTVFAASALRHSLREPNNYFFWFGDIVGPLGMWTRNPYDPSVTPALLGDNMGSGSSLRHYPHGKPALTPYPSYYGMGMFTGLGGLFRRWGANMAATPGAVSGSVPAGTAIAAIASRDNGGDIVIVNQADTVNSRIVVTTTGVTSGPVDVWQTNRAAPWDPPTRVAQTTISGSAFTVTCPAMTVTRCVITP